MLCDFDRTKLTCLIILDYPCLLPYPIKLFPILKKLVSISASSCFYTAQHCISAARKDQTNIYLYISCFGTSRSECVSEREQAEDMSLTCLRHYVYVCLCRLLSFDLEHLNVSVLCDVFAKHFHWMSFNRVRRPTNPFGSLALGVSFLSFRLSAYLLRLC